MHIFRAAKCLVALSAICSNLGFAEINYGLVVSAGTLNDPFISDPFYGSKIFIGAGNAPFIVKDAETKAFENNSAFFFAEKNFSRDDIILARKIEQKNKHIEGFKGFSFIGYPLSGKGVDQGLINYLGVNGQTFVVQVRKHNGKLVYAFSKTGKVGSIVWPQSVEELRQVPAAIISDMQNSFKSIVFSRSVGAPDAKFALIDKLLANKSVPTGLVELGSNHGGKGDLKIAKGKNLLERLMMAFPGTYELASMMVDKSYLSELPKAYPYEGKFCSQTSLTIGSGSVLPMKFCSVTDEENLWPLFDGLGTRATIADAISLMAKDAQIGPKSVNVVRVFSEQAATEVAKSSNVDLVLLLSSDPFMPLPSKESIELRSKNNLSFEQPAPIVRINYLDVTEIIFSGPLAHQIERIDIRRHRVVGDEILNRDKIGPESFFIAKEELCPKRTSKGEVAAWEKDGLQKVLAGMIVKETGSDLAITDTLPNNTPVFGTLPWDLAARLFLPQGRISTIITSGQLLKKILKLATGSQSRKKFSIYGIDEKTFKIGVKPIDKNARYKVALSENALLELLRVGMLGGLSEEFIVRAPFVEAIYGKITNLFFIRGTYAVPASDTMDDIDHAVSNIMLAPSILDMMTRFFAEQDQEIIESFLKDATGTTRHAITLDLAYLDIGLSKNVSNSYYGNPGDANDTSPFKGKNLPVSRAGVPLSAHLFLFTKASLNYENPWLITSLTGDIKYMHTDLKRPPDRDKAKFGLNFRLPWENSLFSESSVVFSPLSKTIYETKLAPHFLANHDKIPPRVKRLSTMLGFNINFKNLKFSVDAGGIMAADFNKNKAREVFDFGPGLDFLGSWSLFGPLQLTTEINSAYYFGLLNSSLQDKLALVVEGKVWLRLARFYDFSISLMSDFLVASKQDDPSRFALSSIFGVTVSYGRLFRLLG